MRSMSLSIFHFTPDQARLDQLMSDLSEDYTCAGWLIGLENSLWLDLTSEHISPSGFWSEDWNGDGTEYRNRLEEIGRMAARCGGWIVWKEGLGERFVSFQEWGEILGLDGPAQLPERFRGLTQRYTDPRARLLEGLSREQLSDLVMASGFCYDHLQKRTEGGGYGSCLHCGGIEANHALSRIAGMIEYGPTLPDGNWATEFDVGMDPEYVVKRVHDFLRKDFHEG